MPFIDMPREFPAELYMSVRTSFGLKCMHMNFETFAQNPKEPFVLSWLAMQHRFRAFNRHADRILEILPEHHMKSFLAEMSVTDSLCSPRKEIKNGPRVVLNKRAILFSQEGSEFRTKCGALQHQEDRQIALVGFASVLVIPCN